MTQDYRTDLTFATYQEAARSTAIYREAGEGTHMALAYVGLGLVSEAGEVAGKVKKLLRDHPYDHIDDLPVEVREALLAEVGDVLWYLAQLANELDTDLGSLAEGNLAKLQSRKERGVIGGSGDKR